MLKQLLTKAPLRAILVVIIIFVIVAGAGLGLEWPLLAAVAVTVFAIAQGGEIWSLRRKLMHHEHHLRQIRFIADRFQSMLRALPGGYCLFTPQGLLREEMGVSERLGCNKITHLDDLIGSVKEGPELLVLFRKLQVNSNSFISIVHSQKNEKPLHVMGRRFRIGTEGPHIDVLWFLDPMDKEISASTIASMEQAAKEIIATKGALDEKAETLAVQAPAPVEVVDIKGYFDVLPFPVWGRAKNLSLVMCNVAYAQALDSTIDEVLLHQQELMPSASKGGRALAEEVLEKQDVRTGRDHVVIHGRRCLMQVTEQPYSARRPEDDADEKSLAILGFAQNVTAEEEKEVELRRHLVSHHEVMEHLGSAICVYGPDARLEFYNRAYQRLWDTPESFLDSKPTFGEVLEDLRARRKIPEQADFRKYKNERMTLFTSLLEPHEDVMYLPDGTSLRVLVAPHPLGGLMFVHENVTDQLELETSYNTLMAVQRETLDNLAEGIAVFGPDGKLRLFNPSLASLWHVPESFLEEQPHVAEFIEKARELFAVEKEKDWIDFKTKIVGFALDRNPHSGRLERADQSIIDFQTVPLPDGAVLNSYLNVTDSVKVEQALRASNAALATADRLKSDFVANVSYQLRTPLNTITGFAEILAEQYFGKLNERQLEYTTTIHAESEKLTRLINDVLDLATIEAGRMTLDCHPVSISSLLNEAKLMTAAWARQQMIEILIDCPSDIGLFDVDEQRIKQVLFNLISNAIKYTPAGGHIAIAAWEQEPWVVISVLDTGVGIPDEDRERVFGKFEKANNHLRQAGAGLGLSLVKSFVELHGGRVEIFSDDKDGTRVSCFLPRQGKAMESTDRNEGR